ncbi:hypothetical protein [Streptomyces sp. CT34]|uniref:hypothetical protein n=1 Tax=Streptomyces sp. CT34 TaxID=1553907 RepID=UPI0005B936F9|nr:hypothetical protein [Streptomyces sp. CT34]
MRKFVPQFQGSPWRDGARVLHAYLVPDLTVDQDLAQLVRSCHEAMKPYPITPLSDNLLHATVEMVADTTADRITDDEREALAQTLRHHLDGAVPFQVMAGSPIANKAEVAA